MNKLKNISASFLIIVGFIFIINGMICFSTIDISIKLYILKFWIIGLIMVGIGAFIKEYINF